jgi:flagellar biosynthesis protein FlhG
LASFDFDQAEGLRRMLAGPRPRVLTFLSALAADDKGAMLVNLAASLARAGNEVLVVDACQHEYGVARRLGVDAAASLLSVARQQCALDQVVQQVPQGFKVASLCLDRMPGADDARRMGKAFELLARQNAIVIVDGEFGADGFPLAIMDSAEIVVQVSTSAASIKAAYGLIKRLSQQLGRRPFGILVTGASESQAKVVYDNMYCAASRYLAVQLTSMGSVPSDEYLHRAARLGRAVVDAFPLAGAAVAYRRLAGRFALGGLQPVSKVPERTGGNAHFGS